MRLNRARRALRLAAVMLALAMIAGCASKHVVYRRADPHNRIELPQDNAGHRDYRTEWWYFTGHLDAEDGREYAFEVTFFSRRTDQDKIAGSIAIKNYSNPAHMAHFAIIDENAGTHFYEERRARDHEDKNGNAGVMYDWLYVWNGDWSLKQIDDDFLLSVRMKGFDLTLLLRPNKPPVLQGRGGYFAKGEQRGTHYISYTNLEADGVLFVDGVPQAVHGRAWHDHEFGSYQLRPEQRGWDWFSLRLDNDVELMLYMLALHDGSYDTYSKGLLVPAQGPPEPIDFEQIELQTLQSWTSPRSKVTYPVRWRLRIPDKQVDLEITPIMPEQEMRTRKTLTQYWEGSVRVSGTCQGVPVTGKGFVELTGYVKPLKWLTKLEVGSVA
ncbi:MAG: lipocalin family protein [Candidatus Alcyoniella australis]|nr:lipocalin family protein [Candidatus Alcyoniella australis]